MSDDSNLKNDHQVQQPQDQSVSSEPPAKESPPEDELAKCKKQAEEYLNGWKRAQADFINYKKDETRRFQEFAKFANEALVRELLAVLDSFELALASLDEKNPAQKGVYIMKSQFEHALKAQGLEEITLNVGTDVFDPAFHEAVGEVESDKPPQTII